MKKKGKSIAIDLNLPQPLVEEYECDRSLTSLTSLRIMVTVGAVCIFVPARYLKLVNELVNMLISEKPVPFFETEEETFGFVLSKLAQLLTNYDYKMRIRKTAKIGTVLPLPVRFYDVHVVFV